MSDFNIKELRAGTVASAVSVGSWNSMARALNHANGANGCRVERDASGGLKVVLGDDQFQFRSITVVDYCVDDEGRGCLALRKCRVLCAMPAAPHALIPTGGGASAQYDEWGDLVSITLGSDVIEVEECNDGGVIIT